MNTVSKLEPLGDRVVIQPLAPEKQTASGIILPGSQSEEKQEQGTVVAVGPGKQLENGERSAMSVVVGDVVLFAKYTPDEVEIDGQKYLVVRDDSILAKIS